MKQYNDDVPDFRDSFWTMLFQHSHDKKVMFETFAECTQESAWDIRDTFALQWIDERDTTTETDILETLKNEFTSKCNTDVGAGFKMVSIESFEKKKKKNVWLTKHAD